MKHITIMSEFSELSVRKVNVSSAYSVFRAGKMNLTNYVWIHISSLNHIKSLS